MMVEKQASEGLPKEMIPTAWKNPLLTNNSPSKLPLSSLGTVKPCVMTVMIITSMLINANVDAFASCDSALVARLLVHSNGEECLSSHLCNVSIKTQGPANS